MAAPAGRSAWLLAVAGSPACGTAAGCGVCDTGGAAAFPAACFVATAAGPGFAVAVAADLVAAGEAAGFAGLVAAFVDVSILAA